MLSCREPASIFIFADSGMRDRPDGASTNSIVWHHGIIQSSFREAMVRIGYLRKAI